MDDTSKAIEGSEELTVEYANNVFFSPNVWDLKLVFGELSGMKQGIEWHTSVTMPWAQAKLMAYYLAINIASYEIENGPIRIPERMLPTVPPLPEGAEKAALHKFVEEHNKRFLEEQKAR